MTDNSATMRKNIRHGKQNSKGNAAETIMSLKKSIAKGKQMTEGQRRADNFLRIIRDEEKIIGPMAQKVEYLRYRATGGGAIRYDKDHVQTSPEDILSSSLAQAVDLEKDIAQAKELIELRRNYTIEKLKTWTDVQSAFILATFYIDSESLMSISRKINRSVRQTNRLKNKALEMFSREL